MNRCILFVLSVFFISYINLGHGNENLRSTSDNGRTKRSAVGALHIVNNHAQPIHADVKPESDGIDKPCSKKNDSSRVETGVGFQVTPPEDAAHIMKSLRKSLPPNHISSTTLDLVRSISRIVSLVILFISAVFEFYPTILKLLMFIYNFIFNQ